jgi:hypothetical protein
MPRYERDYARYDRQFGQRGGSRRYGAEYRRAGYDRSYEGGWGMSHLYNTIMHRGPRGRERYGQEFYRRPEGTSYATDYTPRFRTEYSDRYGGDYSDRDGGDYSRRRAQRSPDQGSVGVHYHRYDRDRF